MFLFCSGGSLVHWREWTLEIVVVHQYVNDAVICVMYTSSVDLIRFQSFQQKRNWKKWLKVCQPSRIISAVRTQSCDWAEGFIIPCRSRLVWIKDNYDIEQTGCEVILKYGLEINKYTYLALLFFLLCAYTENTNICFKSQSCKYWNISTSTTKSDKDISHSYSYRSEQLRESCRMTNERGSCCLFLPNSILHFQDAQKGFFHYCIHFPS